MSRLYKSNKLKWCEKKMVQIYDIRSNTLLLKGEITEITINENDIIIITLDTAYKINLRLDEIEKLTKFLVKIPL